jgi:uncharacterized protein
MPSRQDALLNLSSLLTHAPGAPLEVEGEGLLMPTPDQLRADGLRLAAPLAWRVTVRSTGGDDDFIAEGEVEGTAVMECRRCLADVETTVTASFLYPMVYRPGQEEGLTLIEAPVAGEAEDVSALDEAGEDRLAFPRPEVDFAPLLRQVFAIDLPLTVLCKPECRGLSIDGVNLNEHPDHRPAGADQPQEESPFAVLEDLDLDSRS